LTPLRWSFNHPKRYRKPRSPACRSERRRRRQGNAGFTTPSLTTATLDIAAGLSSPAESSAARATRTTTRSFRQTEVLPHVGGVRKRRRGFVRQAPPNRQRRLHPPQRAARFQREEQTRGKPGHRTAEAARSACDRGPRTLRRLRLGAMSATHCHGASAQGGEHRGTSKRSPSEDTCISVLVCRRLSRHESGCNRDESPRRKSCLLRRADEARVEFCSTDISAWVVPGRHETETSAERSKGSTCYGAVAGRGGPALNLRRP